MAEKVGFIGLGRMGRPFATNIVKSGFDLVVYDLQPDPVAELVQLGARSATSPREVAEQSDIVLIAIRHEPDVDARRSIDVVMHGPDGMLAGAHPGLAVVIQSAMHPTKIQQVAAEAGNRGIGVLDAQMSGGIEGVRRQSLCLMVGGDARVLERCRPVLETTGANIFLLGGIGMGAVTKIVQNTMTAMHLLAASEGFRLAEKAGIDLEVYQEVVRTSAAQSHVADGYLHGRGRSEGRWSYYPILWNALDLGHTYDLSLPGAAACMQALAHTPPVGGVRSEPPIQASAQA
jgi:3-hydroxyisobutyrate dehydrogenase-like beta-hydroxyacid dehydrogenase